jgi:diguanylate cyclase (GGDEF)-like protein/PAS domain S-box-containing protein
MMLDLYLTPASISYLNQFLLSLLIVGYLGFRFHGKTDLTWRDIYLIVFFASITAFSALLFFDVSLLPSARLPFVFLQNTVLAILLIALVQFAYAFPVPRGEQSLERRLVLLAFVVYAFFEAGFAIWRFILLADGLVEFRFDWMDAGPALGFLWVIFVFMRAALQNWKVPASRRFALIFVIPLALAFLNLLRTYYLIPMPFYHISMSIGIIFTTFLFGLNYLTALPEQISLMAKFSAEVITALLAVLGIVAWLVAPAYVQRYHVDIREKVTLSFVPSTDGSYSVSQIPFRYETDLGQKLHLTDDPTIQPIITIPDFNFEFFGQIYETVQVSNDGFLNFGEQSQLKSLKHFESRFSSTPLILALFLDLDVDNSEGGIYLHRDTGKLVVTYDRIPAFLHPKHVFTFQIVLHADNTFEISYHSLPENLNYYINDRPDATLWAMGIKPGNTDYQEASLFALPLEVGPQGLIDDQYRAFRAYLHAFILPLAITILLCSLLFTLGLPLLLHLTLTRPLATLLVGARAWNEGRFGVQVPVQFNDEVGFLTDSFNRLGMQLNSQVRTLETRVAERTEALSTANKEMRKLFITVQQSPSSIVITDLDANIEYANPAFSCSSGYTLQEILGKNPSILKSNRTTPATYEEMWQTIIAGKIWRGELCNRRKDGEEYWEYTVIAPIRNGANEVTHYVAIKEDVTSRVLAEQGLKESEKQYRDLFNLESDAIFIIRNADGRILEANSAASSMYGFSQDELKQLTNADLSAEPEKTKKATQAPLPVDQIVSIPLRMHRRKDGTVFPVEITARFIDWKGESVHIAAIRDITERRKNETELERLAVTDALTGLYNRRHFYESAEKLFHRAKHETGNMIIFMMDIDHFKQVNDVFGHQSGDIVLREVTHRIQELLRPTDVLARYGGEEFVAVLLNIQCEDSCRIAERVLQAIRSQPILAGGNSVSVTLSLGIAQFQPNHESLDNLLSDADQALYLAKKNGRDCWANFKKDSSA